MLTIYENTPRDKEYLMNEFTRATRDSDDKSEAVKRGNRTKLKSGYIPSGRLAEGFMHLKNDRDEMVIGADPVRLPLIKKALDLVIRQTHTPMLALDCLNNEWGYRTKKTKRTGGKPMSKSTWYKLLSDSKYYGVIERSEGTFNFANDVPKALTKDDFERIQLILGNKMTKRLTKKDWPYTGLGIICSECKGTVIQDEKWQIICPVCRTKFHKAKKRDACIHCHTLIKDMKQPKILHYVYLLGNHKQLSNGSCKQPSLAVKDFEAQIDALIAKFTIPASFTKWAIKWLQNEHTKEVSNRTNIKKNLQDLDIEVQRQIDELMGLRLRRQIDDTEYNKSKKLLFLEQQQVREKLKTADKRADTWLELSEKTFNFACYARHWFANGTTQQKREILSTIGSNLMLQDKKLLLYQRKPFSIISGMKEKIEILLDVFEPDDLLEESSYSDTSTPMIPTLLPNVSTLRTHFLETESLFEPIFA